VGGVVGRFARGESVTRGLCRGESNESVRDFGVEFSRSRVLAVAAPAPVSQQPPDLGGGAAGGASRERDTGRPENLCGAAPEASLAAL